MSASTSHRQPLSDIANAHAEKKPFDLFRMPRRSRLGPEMHTEPQGEDVSKGNDKRDHDIDLEWISEEELRKSKTKGKLKKRIHDTDPFVEKKPRKRKAKGAANAALEKFWQSTESAEPEQNYTIEHGIGAESQTTNDTPIIRHKPAPALATTNLDNSSTEPINLIAKPVHPFFRNGEDASSTTVTEASSSDEQSKEDVSEEKSIASTKPVHPFFLPKVEELALGQDIENAVPDEMAVQAMDVESTDAEITNAAATESKLKASATNKTASTPHPFFAKRDQIFAPTKASALVPRIFQSKIDAPWPRPFECEPLVVSPPAPSDSWSCSLGKRKRKHAAGRKYSEDTLLSTLARLLPMNDQSQHNAPEILLTAQSTIVNVANGLCKGPKHPAISKLLKSLSDRNTYLRYPFRPVDTDIWAEKYRPRNSAEVIGNQAAVSSLRSWLQEMKLPPSMRRNPDQTDSALVAMPIAAPMHKKPAVQKKKRRQPNELDDFIVEDEEDDHLQGPARPMFDDTTDDESFSPNTTPRKRQAKIIDILPSVTILVGPPGSGKTASIYACAEELGFQVFEIFGGMKRSGKDISAAVGDMTQNHLVRSNAVVPADPFASTQTDDRETDQVEAKQSLILLDDVDIIYDDDKNFWPAITALVEKSRRPVIMTCNDLHLIPIRDLPHSVVFEFTRPSEQLSMPFLLLIALNEGHTLNAADVDRLLNECQGDLRKTICQLQFSCQFAKSAIEIGDANGNGTCAMSLSTFSCDRLLREDAYSVEQPLHSDMRIRLGDSCKSMQLSALEALSPWSAIQALPEAEQYLDTLQALSHYADTASVLDLYQAVKSAPRDRDNYVYKSTENDEFGYTVIPDIEPGSFEDDMASDVEWQHLNLLVLKDRISSVQVKSDHRGNLRDIASDYHASSEDCYGDFIHYGQLYSRPTHLDTLYGPYIRIMVANDTEQMDNTAAFVAARGQRATRSRAYRRHINVSEDQAKNILDLGLDLGLDK